MGKQRAETPYGEQRDRDRSRLRELEESQNPKGGSWALQRIDVYAPFNSKR